MSDKFEQVRVRCLSNEPTRHTVGIVTLTINATRDCTVGKVYEAERIPKGAIDYEGFPAVDDGCVTFIDDVGERVTHYIGPTLEVVDE